MARIKANGSKLYAVINGAIVRVQCISAMDLGQDSFGKIDASCLDDDHKSYDRGVTDPGEGSITIQLDDTNTSHATLLQLAESGTKTDWYIGSPSATDEPELDSSGDVILPETRTWLTFEGYLNPVAPTIETDTNWTYAFTLVRTSPVRTILADTSA